MSQQDHNDLTDVSLSEQIVNDPSDLIADRFTKFVIDVHGDVCESEKHAFFATWFKNLHQNFINHADVLGDSIPPHMAEHNFYTKFEPYAKWFLIFGYIVPSQYIMDSMITNKYPTWTSQTHVESPLPHAAQTNKSTSGVFKLSPSDTLGVSEGKALYAAAEDYFAAYRKDNFIAAVMAAPDVEYTDRHRLMIMNTGDKIAHIEELRGIIDKQSQTVLHAKDIIEDHKAITIQRNNLKDQLVIATNAVIPLQEEHGNLMTFQRRVLETCGFSHEGLSSGAVTIDDLIDIISDAIDGDDDG